VITGSSGSIDTICCQNMSLTLWGLWFKFWLWFSILFFSPCKLLLE
jgi:hypothetical protein